MKPRKYRIASGLSVVLILAVFACFPVRSLALPKDDETLELQPQELQSMEEVLQVPESETETETAFSGFGDSAEDDMQSGGGQFTTMPVSECSLSYEPGVYCYAVSDTERFYMNIPDGAVTDGPVEIRFSSNRLGIYSIEYEGNEDPNVLARKFEDEGTYRLLLYFVDTEAAAASTDLTGTQIPVTFQIRNKTDSKRQAIPEPTGFYFRSVMLDGEKIAAPDHALIPDRDGAYEIVFAAEEDPEITYTYSVEIDTTAPELRFSKDVESGNAWTPVTYDPVEPDSEVHVYRDYREYEFADRTLTRGGSYGIIVSDPAGNSRTYRFDLKENPVRKIVACIAAGLVILAGVIVYMRYIRDHMNIL